MTTTWAQLLKDLREDLQDTGANPRWGNYMLWLYTKDAVRDYSIWFPKRVDSVTLVESGDGYALPDDYYEDITVECPEDTFLERRRGRPGIRFLTKSTPNLYHIDGGLLYLNGSPSDDVIFTYFAIHSIPATEKDKTFTFTVPDSDMELLRIYVKAQVHGQMRGKQSRLDRFEPGAGRRDDNPLEPETNSLMNEYYGKIALRAGGGAIVLTRPGRVR